jgi:hypothetical protein
LQNRGLYYKNKMVIKFLKDHLEYKTGQVVNDHPNADYLVRCKVAEVEVEKTKQGNEKDKQNKATK